MFSESPEFSTSINFVHVAALDRHHMVACLSQTSNESVNNTEIKKEIQSIPHESPTISVKDCLYNQPPDCVDVSPTQNAFGIGARNSSQPALRIDQNNNGPREESDAAQNYQFRRLSQVRRARSAMSTSREQASTKKSVKEALNAQAKENLPPTPN